MSEIEERIEDAYEKENSKLKAELVYWKELAERLMKISQHYAHVTDLMFDYDMPELF